MRARHRKYDLLINPQRNMSHTFYGVGSHHVTKGDFIGVI